MKGPADKLMLRFPDGSSLPLGSDWFYAVATNKSPPPRAPWDANAGLGLIYNGMIAPMGGFGLRGVAWYQGESDVGVAGYAQRLGALFTGWRDQFGRADLPMLVVELPNFGPVATSPTDSGWAALREAQRAAVAADARAARAVTLDLGDRTNLHPLGKAPVGVRLARAARALAHGAALAPSGPQIAGAARDGNSIVLRFGGVTGALHGWSDTHILGFELCAQTQASCRYVPARASGDTVVLAGDDQPATRIRYAWADSPVVNLYDEAELTPGSFEVPIAP
jgi:sialate O-acetylesterase